MFNFSKGFEETLKNEIRQELLEEFEFVQELGYKRTKEQFEKELHSRFFRAGIKTNYTSVYVKI